MINEDYLVGVKVHFVLPLGVSDSIEAETAALDITREVFKEFFGRAEDVKVEIVGVVKASYT